MKINKKKEVKKRDQVKEWENDGDLDSEDYWEQKDDKTNEH